MFLFQIRVSAESNYTHSTRLPPYCSEQCLYFRPPFCKKWLRGTLAPAPFLFGFPNNLIKTINYESLMQHWGGHPCIQWRGEGKKQYGNARILYGMGLSKSWNHSTKGGFGNCMGWCVCPAEVHTKNVVEKSGLRYTKLCGGVRVWA